MTTTSTTTAPLAASCGAFAQALMSTPEYEAWRAARADRERDADVAGLRADLRRLGVELRLAQERRDPEATSLTQRYAAVQSDLQTHPAAVRQQEAARALIEMLRLANTLLRGALGVDFAAMAAPPKGGGCCG